MPTYTVHQAKTQLSELLRRVEAGEEVIIARGDKPVAVLKSYDLQELAARRRAGEGSFAGKIPHVPDSAFFDPLSDEELDAFYNSKLPE